MQWFVNSEDFMVKFSLMMPFFFLLFMFSFNFAWVAHAADSKEVDNKAYWLCKNKQEVRTIRVHIDDAGICFTFYSKQGSEKLVGSAKSKESCFNFLNNIKANLEKSGWSCRDITDTKITASVE